ncbi:hypothetical protein [Halomonas sp. KO116]|uniref:hypothetical protein n=1 Tax=Halomonas sp. KO116 TaxID=1504981 RepID=UPI0004E3007D|nr:hypothetical protein [Halomonas sp. KO116]AJY53200.1 hypothetical protein KO116_P200093 [Halomonas sp. KO116]
MRPSLKASFKRRQATMDACWERHSGNPIGVQLKTTTDLYAVILPDATEPGHYRAQFFDEKGFSGHSTYATPEQVLKDLISTGYVLTAKNALETLSTQESWRLGVQAQEYRDLFHYGKLTFSEMLTAIDALYSTAQQAA